MSTITFQQRFWADFTTQRSEPDDLTLRYGGTGRSEEKLPRLRGFTLKSLVAL